MCQRVFVQYQQGVCVCVCVCVCECVCVCDDGLRPLCWAKSGGRGIASLCVTPMKKRCSQIARTNSCHSIFPPPNKFSSLHFTTAYKISKNILGVKIIDETNLPWTKKSSIALHHIHPWYESEAKIKTSY